MCRSDDDDDDDDDDGGGGGGGDDDDDDVVVVVDDDDVVMMVMVMLLLLMMMMMIIMMMMMMMTTRRRTATTLPQFLSSLLDFCSPGLAAPSQTGGGSMRVLAHPTPRLTHRIYSAMVEKHNIVFHAQRYMLKKDLHSKLEP